MEADGGRLGFELIGFGGGCAVEQTPCLSGSPLRSPVRTAVF
jgi:hypothetical protein